MTVILFSHKIIFALDSILFVNYYYVDNCIIYIYISVEKNV